MNIFNWYETIGLAGSLLVALSMTMKHAKTLRIVNLLGCIVFTVYGVLMQSLSVTLLNVFTIVVNAYFLINFRIEHTRQEAFDVLFKDPGVDEYIRRFILFHSRDINRFFPSFDQDPETGSLAGTECCFILRQTLPVSIVAFRREEGGEISVILDYAIPSYRDFKNGKFFFERAVSQIATPGTVFEAIGEVPAHSSYLKKLGFVEVHNDEKGRHFRKEFRG